MRKSLLILSILFFILLLVTAPVWAVVPNQPTGSKADNIIDDIITDFKLLSDLLASKPDIHNRAEAAAWLSQGFESQLAASVVDCYLQPDPELNGMAVIVTDSIPIITATDHNLCQVTQLDTVTARLDRVYSNCYSPGDRWLYQVTVKKYERWKIADIRLIPLTLTCFPSNP